MPPSGTPGPVDVLRLAPGADPRAALDRWCSSNRVEAAVVLSAMGSLSTAALRCAGQEQATVISGDLEVCSLTGTLSHHGLHLHLVVSDAEGRCTGGHLLMGSVVRTTLELALLRIDGLVLERTHDPATGHHELVVRALRDR